MAEVKSNTRNYVHLKTRIIVWCPPCWTAVFCFFYSSLEWTNQTLESAFFVFFPSFEHEDEMTAVHFVGLFNFTT